MEHTKGHRTSSTKPIEITFGVSGDKRIAFKVTNAELDKIKSFLTPWIGKEEEVTSWEQASLWENVAAERIERYTKAGIALRGARYREGYSQKQLAELCKISQDNLSRMENGKRVIGEKTAKKLAKILHVDYRIFLNP